jgi:hypothetical protein
MDIYIYLLEGVVGSTTPPGETTAETQSRRDAIAAMFSGYDPSDMKEAMIACHCIELQFLLKAAIRDASNVQPDPDRSARARAGAMALSKTWNQWVTKLEKIQQRKEARAEQALKAARTDAASGISTEAEPMAAKPVATPPSKATSGSARSEPEQEPAPPGQVVFGDAPPIPVVAVPPSVRSSGSQPPGVSPALATQSNVPGPNVPGPNVPGPNVPGPNVPGPNVPGRGAIPVWGEAESAANHRDLLPDVSGQDRTDK